MASAHLVPSSKGLRALTDEADVVVRARIAERLDAGPSPRAAGRPYVEAYVLEVLKGDPGEPPLRFLQHGHGVAPFEAGREHLVFLVRTERSRELDALGPKSHPFVSLQEHDDAYPLEAPTRVALLAAARAYAAADAAETGDERDQHLRTATLALLESRDPGLSGPTIRDWMAAPTTTPITTDERPRLVAIVDDPKTPMSVRLALLRALEARGLLDGTTRWTALLDPGSSDAALVATIRASAIDPRPAIRQRLIALVGSDREDVAAAAAIAVGWPGDERGLDALGTALASRSTRVRNGAVRALGRIGSPRALALLDEAGQTHSDPATRRLAAAEARKLRGRDSGS